MIYAVTGKTEGIAPADIYLAPIQTALETLAGNTSKYGMMTADLLNAMAARGSAFLHVASAFEEGTMRLNAEKGAQLRWPLVLVFPADGTFWSDHPYCVLDGSGWVTPEEATNHFVRPLDGKIAPDTKLAQSGGTDLAASPVTIPDFAIPSPEVSEAIIDQFYNTKRKATVVLALDVSGSMSGEAIRAATESTAEFLDRLHPEDRVGLIAFNQVVQELAPISPVADVVEGLKRQVLALPADGGTNLHGAICRTADLCAPDRLLTAPQGLGCAGKPRRRAGAWGGPADDSNRLCPWSSRRARANCLASWSWCGRDLRPFARGVRAIASRR